MRKLTVSLLLLTLFHLNSVAYAAQPWGNCLQDGDVATIQCLVPLFRNIVVAVMQLVGVGLFIMIIIGGFTMIMSGGNPKQLEQAKGTLTYAILGVVLIVLAYLIIQLISTITGVPNLNRFEIPSP